METYAKNVPQGFKRKRLPVVRVSSAKNLTQGFNFIVTLNEFTYGFQSVSGLEVEREVESFSEGGVNDHQILVGKPVNNIFNLTFTRGLMIRSPGIITNAAKAAALKSQDNTIRKAAMIGVAALDPQESLEAGPAIGTIQVFNRQNELTALYSFLSLGATRWNASDLNADDGAISIETITIVHTGLTRVALSGPSIINYAKSFSSDNDDDLAKMMEERKKELQDQNEKIQKDLENSGVKKKREEVEKAKKDFDEALKKLEAERKKAEEALAEKKKLQLELQEEEKKAREKAIEENKQNVEKERKKSEERAKQASEKNEAQENLNKENAQKSKEQGENS